MEKEKLRGLLIEYLSETAEEVRAIAKKGNGKEVLGDVINRPEDIEIGIDRVGEKILEKLLKKRGLSAKIFSEPENRDIKSGENPEIYGSIDPFDGSMLFLKGLEHNWYSALSFYGKEREPLAAGIVDILNRKIFFSAAGGNKVMDIKTGETRPIAPSRRKKLDKNAVLASYLMSSRYSAKFFDVFGGLVKSLHPKAMLYPNGGSYIYAYLAAGLVDAYVMFDEPRSEIDPGFPIAKRAGCEVVSVNPDGSYENYKFAPGKQHGKVNLLVAACTPELRDELIRHFAEAAAAKG